jgi:four helix bundle protein
LAAIASFRDLLVWQKSATLAATCYRITSAFAREHRFDLVSQIRRAATSIPANIAEGHNRRGRRLYAHYIGIALGSLAELESHLELAARVGIASAEDSRRALQLAEELNRMLHALAKALEGPPRQR